MQRNELKLKKLWELEENIKLTGWDFSRISRFHQEGTLSWNYKQIVEDNLKETDVLLDMGTADGKFLESISHSHSLTSVTEAFPPNIALCKKTLEPKGIKVYPITNDMHLPMENDSFDCVINRHEAFNCLEVYRVLKPNGRFITQQVGGLNNSEIAQFIFPEELRKSNPRQFLVPQIQELKKVGFEIELAQEEFPFTTFTSVEAFVYFAKRIEWEFPNFSVESSFKQLLKLEELVEKEGYFTVKEHRFVLVARKK